MGTERNLENPMTVGSNVRCIITHRGRVAKFDLWTLHRQKRKGNPWINTEIPSTIGGIVIDTKPWQPGTSGNPTIMQYFILVQLPEFLHHPDAEYNTRYHVIAQTEKELDIFWEPTH